MKDAVTGKEKSEWSLVKFIENIRDFKRADGVDEGNSRYEVAHTLKGNPSSTITRREQTVGFTHWYKHVLVT